MRNTHLAQGELLVKLMDEIGQLTKEETKLCLTKFMSASLAGSRGRRKFESARSRLGIATSDPRLLKVSEI